MKAQDWIKEFRNQVAKGDIKPWFLTSTGEWKLLADDEEMPKGRIQIQINFLYLVYNTK